MSDDSAPLIELGAVGAPFGIRGWIKIRSFTDPPERLFEHRRLSVGRHGSWNVFRIESTGRSGGQLTAKLVGIEDRDQAAGLRGLGIAVPRVDLPPRAQRDFYRADLIGCAVETLAGLPLGRVDHFIETPGQALMVVKGAKEFWIPAVPKHLRRVDLEARRLVVDWDDAVQ
jgi:16S rRNA processing protein RimM